MRPDPTTYDSALAAYIDLVPEEEICDALDAQSGETQRLLAAVDDERAGYRYAPDKWSIKEVVGHIADAERIFGYRALAVARGETRPLPGFDENAYARNAGFDAWRIGDLSESFALLRRANIVLFRNLAPDAWTRSGTANGRSVSVLALAYVTLGHERHHLKVLRERYGLG